VLSSSVQKRWPFSAMLLRSHSTDRHEFLNMLVELFGLMRRKKRVTIIKSEDTGKNHKISLI